ncbi:RNA polymerase sigma-70 factor [Opitutaceae bacterium EW11]|nr:RNA polymerase sigma-70 factor [Opitutaceae bacterium EW11]
MADPFIEHRPLLFGIAYRMLGSVTEAEDAVQDVYLRWQREAATAMALRSAKAWLITATTRLCIDRLRSARRRREEYFGVWLPEPLVQTTPSDAPDANAALADSLSTAFLLLLETLTPDERAIFLLHEAFDYSHEEIADIVGKTEANCRQIYRRAKEHLAQKRERRRGDPARAETLVQRFLMAARGGDMAELISVLSEDAVLRTDGGGRVRASPTPIEGPDRIGRFLVGIRGNIPADARYNLQRINGGIGVIVVSAGQPIAALTFAVEGDRIQDIYSVSNPDKLRHLTG